MKDTVSQDRQAPKIPPQGRQAKNDLGGLGDVSQDRQSAELHLNLAALDESPMNTGVFDSAKVVRHLAALATLAALGLTN